MNRRERMARGALNSLAEISKGRGLYGIPMARKHILKDVLLEATGCRIEISRGRNVLLRDDVHIDTEGKVPAEDVASHMVEWMKDGPMPWSRRVELPAGSMEIMERVGLVPSKVALLLEAIHYITHEQKSGGVLDVRSSGQGVTAIYEGSGTLKWENGLVTIRSKGLPASVGTAFMGKTLSQLVEDDLIGDRIIRKICDVAPNEGVLRIVTTDQGRYRIEGN